MDEPPTSGHAGDGGFTFDFFISRRGPVRDMATLVADVLKEAGYKVFVQDYDIAVGSDFIQKMHLGLVKARHLIVLLTDDYDQQPFTWWEFSAFASAAPPSVGQRRLVILRVAPCEPRGLLSSIVFQDLVGVDDPVERRQRILDAAAGVSAPAPFKLFSTRLKDGLLPYSEVSDAWLRLTEGQLTSEVPFVGRETEMARLLAFATSSADPRPFTWQVLWGAHATGKSRLAREWLRVLGASTPAWDGGFAAYGGAEVLSLLSLEPSAPTAIVIDDAASYGESLWLFLQRAARWRSADKPVRVLLVAHEDLAPPAVGGFERVDTIRALRQVAPLDRARTAALFQAGRAKSTIQSVPGIRLDPLGMGAEQAALLDAVANRTHRPLSADERNGILKDADGRPALLILAATDPDGWRHRLTDYARMIAKDAESLFAPSYDGLKVLAASVLVGPFSDQLRRIIAPGATPPDRLMRLFPGSSTDLASEIPRFQPDILGFHVLRSALGVLSSSERQELARNLQDANRDRFVAQIDACFCTLEPAYAYYCRLLVPAENREHAKFAAALDDLVTGMAEHPDHLINRPSSQASYKRRDAILSILEIIENLSEADLAKVVREALKFGANNGFGEILELALAENGLARTEVARWLALIEKMTSAFGPIVRARTSVAAFGRRNPQTDEGAAAMMAALKSPVAFDRMEAAYELGDWLEKNPADGRFLVKARPDLLAELTSMMEGRSDHDRTAAAWCLKQADRWVVPLEPSAEIDKIVESAFAWLRRWIAAPEPTHAVGQLIHLHGFNVDCRIAEQERHWFDDVVDLPQAPQHHLGSDAIALLRRIATEAYDTSCIGPRLVAFNAEAAAHVLMRAGLYEPGAGTTEERVLLDGKTTVRKLSTLCRVAATRTAEAHAFLTTVIGKMNDRDEVALFVCAFALLSGELGVVDVMRPIVERSRQPVDLDALLVAARERTHGGAWRGEAVSALRKRLADFRVRRSGHLIHKLKAKDSTGRWAYYFLLVQPDKEPDFMTAIGGSGIIDLEDYGTVIASCYGESPNDETVAFLKERYDFDVNS